MSETKEQAIQSYLAFLDDPEGVDRELIAELEKQLAAAVNPIVKLRVLAEIERVRTTDKVALEESFVQHAGAWAAENNIPPSAFLALGVAPQLLTKAGFELPIPSRSSRALAGTKIASKLSKTAAKRSGLDGGPRKPRAQSVNSETVEKIVLATTEPFSIRDIVDVSHATNATVSRVVGWLVAAQRVEKLGLLTPQGSRGIAPTGYRVKKAASKKG
jgi:hypothetical protein